MILRYLKGTTALGIFYKKRENNLRLTTFIDSGYAEDLDDRRSTSRLMFMMRSGVVSWSSNKQTIIALLTTGAE